MSEGEDERPDAGEERTPEQIEAAVERLGESGRIAEAEALIGRAAPGLQRILVQALADGGWFGEPHDAEVRRVAAIEDPDERVRAVATLLAEETRIGMMVGATVGYALAEELEGR